MGAQIEGAGTHQIRVRGVEKLHGARHRIIPDRIEAGTFIIAGALTGGDLHRHGLRSRITSTRCCRSCEECGVNCRRELASRCV